MIKRSGKTTIKREVPRHNKLLQKFRGIKKGSVLPGDTIVEKKGRPRLDRQGELLQISFFRQQALKRQILGQVQRPTKPIPEPMVPNPIMINNRRRGVARFL